ncbi:hypothetical protein PG999_007779 [Apiospora kogelbergensis]|uniref:Uncharacterized protein n=1 Tax=Apiospora kogelbergensis TaxID=1337665 RepID=A0AAW0QLZ8_9PEZI
MASADVFDATGLEARAGKAVEEENGVAVGGAGLGPRECSAVWQERGVFIAYREDRGGGSAKESLCRQQV